MSKNLKKSARIKRVDFFHISKRLSRNFCIQKSL